VRHRRLALFAASAGDAVALLDARSGKGFGVPAPAWVAPKNTSAALSMALLDAGGGPGADLALSGPAHLPWAGNVEAPPAEPAAVFLPPLPGASSHACQMMI